MRAILFLGVNKPLKLSTLPTPTPQEDEVLIKVQACAVCRTDLHILDGELPSPKLPLVLGHQIVGTIASCGKQVKGLQEGMLVGVPWLAKTCGVCRFCKNHQENLCDAPLYTGYTKDGGFAEYTTAFAPFVYPLPKEASAVKIAPLLCGGLIGYRALRFVKNAQKIGFYGFGAAAHILTQICVAQKKEVFAFTRPEDAASQAFALKIGASWAGSSLEKPPASLDAALIFAPVGSLIIEALKQVKKGGKVICAGIHMSPIPSFSYDLLWEERSIQSVANLTREDGKELLHLANQLNINTTTTLYSLEETENALKDLKEGKVQGSAVIAVDANLLNT